MFQIIRTSLKPHGMQRRLCSTDPKELSRVGPKMPTKLTELSEITTKDIAKMQLTGGKDDLQWRTPWHQKEGQYYSMLRTFYTEHNNANVLKFIQQPINLTPASVRGWWRRRNEERNIAMQQYLPERNQMLGNELAAAHFLVYRGGSVKFYGEDVWVKADAYQEYTLPTEFQDDMFLQAIDCTDMDLYYEGLVNLRNLRQVEWLSLNGCLKLDDWALDRVSCLFMESLLYLDLRNMPGITFRGLGALYKMDKLKILYLDDNAGSREFEMTCLLLQEIKPDLDIRYE